MKFLCPTLILFTHIDTTDNMEEKINNDPTKHYPNANEAKTLRRIMSTTGLSEEQVRLHPQYRKELSLAQKEGQKPISCQSLPKSWTFFNS